MQLSVLMLRPEIRDQPAHRVHLDMTILQPLRQLSHLTLQCHILTPQLLQLHLLLAVPVLHGGQFRMLLKCGLLTDPAVVQVTTRFFVLMLQVFQL